MPKNTPGQVVNKLIKADPGVIYGDVEAALKEFNLAAPVLRDWCNEPSRRRAMMAKVAQRRLKKLASNVTRKGDDFRRIIKVMPIGYALPCRSDNFNKTHQAELHATKGWRSYRAVA